jgi:hypothetical protein
MVFFNKFLAAGLFLSLQSASPFQAAKSATWGKVGTRNDNSIQNLRLSSTSARTKPGTAELDTPWEELGFEFRETNSHVSVTYKDGEWGKPELVKVSTLAKTFAINLIFPFLYRSKWYSLSRFPAMCRVLTFHFTLEPLLCIMVNLALKVLRHSATKMTKSTCSVPMKMPRECNQVVAES